MTDGGMTRDEAAALQTFTGRTEPCVKSDAYGPRKFDDFPPCYPRMCEPCVLKWMTATEVDEKDKSDERAD